MLIVSWNVNGIRAANKNVYEFIKKFNPSIIGFHEIKSKELPLNLQIENYEVIVNHAKKAGYAGTAILTKVKPKEIVMGLNSEKFDSEGRVVSLIFKRFTLVNAYFPHSRRDLSRLKFKMEFNERFEEFVSQFKRVIMMGDFNVAHREIDIARPKQNEGNAGFTNEERAWMERFTNKYIDVWRYLHPNERKYTYWSYMFNARKKNIGWRIDYFLVSKNILKYVTDCKIFEEVMGSDHAPIGLYLKDELIK